MHVRFINKNNHIIYNSTGSSLSKLACALHPAIQTNNKAFQIKILERKTKKRYIRDTLWL